MTIYSLYVKTHTITGLKYLGYTQRNPHEYSGSGSYWTAHLKKHGYKIDTKVLLETESKDEIKSVGKYYSDLWNIVEAKDANGKKLWANLKPEEGVGMVNTFPEVDGVVRRTPLLIASGGKLYPSLAMETLRVAGADTTFQVKLNENGVEKMRIPKFGPITTDSLSRIWIDWSMVPEVHSLADLPKDFDGEIVIVGVSAAGLANPVATSKGEMLPQELQAAVLGTVIANKDRNPISRPDWADGAEILLMLGLGLVLVFFANWRKK